MNVQNSPPRVHDSKLEHYKVRLIAKLCLVLSCAFQFIPRLIMIFTGATLTPQATKFMIGTFAFNGSMILVIVIEYLLFRKKGVRVIKYSSLVDLLLLVLFMRDWIIALLSALYMTQPTHPPSFKISALYGFTTFTWRTLLVTLIVSKWYLKIIPPIIGISIATGYAIYYTPTDVRYIMIRFTAHIITLIIVIYCDDKLKWRMVWTNMQQQKWIQVNNFILNNIPENIMILDLKGEVKFMSDYCKSFMKICQFTLDDTKDFFGRIRDLNQEAVVKNKVVLQMEQMTTGNELLVDGSDSNAGGMQETLQDLITNFPKMNETKDVQERQFLIFHGKLKTMDEEEIEKSIEIKISFAQNLEDEYIILILRDTTQRDLLVALEETNKYKDQLLASVSHELRAPLNGNINMVEGAVNSKKIPDSVKESLLIPALRSSKFLLHIINDILDMSQIKEKKLRLAFQSGDLIETIKGTAQLVELQAQKKGIKFLMEIDPDLSKTFCTDHMRLSQIVLNLLNNAIKFTRKGVVKLIATPLSEEKVKISVEDTGIGMSEDNVKKLFRHYTHIEFEGRQNMNPTGVGLGLNIAYNLAVLLGPKEHHQGIHVTSTSGEGSIFTFIIENKEIAPMQLDDIPSAKTVKSANNNNDSREVAEESPGIIRPKFKIQRTSTSMCTTPIEFEYLSEPTVCSCPQIMVVDDNPFNTMAFETILSSLDMKCDTVYSGACAIKKLLNREKERCGQDCKPYLVVFMDQEMPEMNGSETTREIRKLQRQNLISPLMKVIGCTAHKSKEDVERFMEAGLDQCIHKPISPAMIKGILSESLLSASNSRS